MPPIELAYMSAYLEWRRSLIAGKGQQPVDRRLADGRAAEALHQAAEATWWHAAAARGARTT